MKKNSKERLFEVMGRLDKTFKPKLNEGSEETKPTLNEGFEEIEATSDVEIPAEIGAGEEIPVEEKTPEEKLAELTAKVDEIYALVHGEVDSEEIAAEVPAGEPEEISVETGEIEPENLQEWNFDKKKGEKEKDDKEDKKEKKEEVDEGKAEDMDNDGDIDSDDYLAKKDAAIKKSKGEEVNEAKPKIPVTAVAKVGK